MQICGSVSNFNLIISKMSGRLLGLHTSSLLLTWHLLQALNFRPVGVLKFAKLFGFLLHSLSIWYILKIVTMQNYNTLIKNFCELKFSEIYLCEIHWLWVYFNFIFKALYGKATSKRLNENFLPVEVRELLSQKRN